MDFQPGEFVNVKLNFSAMEVNVIRPFVTGSLQTFYKLDDPELIPESDRKENRRPQAANRGPRKVMAQDCKCAAVVNLNKNLGSAWRVILPSLRKRRIHCSSLLNKLFRNGDMWIRMSCLCGCLWNRLFEVCSTR